MWKSAVLIAALTLAAVTAAPSNAGPQDSRKILSSTFAP